MSQGFAIFGIENPVTRFINTERIIVEQFSNEAKAEIESSIKEAETYIESVENKIFKISEDNAFETAVQNKVNIKLCMKVSKSVFFSLQRNCNQKKKNYFSFH